MRSGGILAGGKINDKTSYANSKTIDYYIIGNTIQITSNLTKDKNNAPEPIPPDPQKPQKPEDKNRDSGNREKYTTYYSIKQN